MVSKIPEGFPHPDNQSEKGVRQLPIVVFIIRY